ncbi:hypothetical protein [Paraburkholderia sp.]|uniref:hypothetical protein n=1 Tax=Paraburkholderia sp. TaxID=1926495 RepID=UPI0023953072|nr:hypothetical protein [Paraburkholderia sp.]MDE1181059.1 hypothetical protein [Paraburkholderia sp.]
MRKSDLYASTKASVEKACALVIYHVLGTQGFGMLARGTLCLTHTMEPVFRSGRHYPRDDLAAAVILPDLGYLRFYAASVAPYVIRNAISNPEAVHKETEKLIRKIFEFFARQSRVFDALPSGHAVIPRDAQAILPPLEPSRRFWILESNGPRLASNEMEYLEWANASDQIVRRSTVGRLEISTCFYGVEELGDGTDLEPKLFATTIRRQQSDVVSLVRDYRNLTHAFAEHLHLVSSLRAMAATGASEDELIAFANRAQVPSIV